MHRREVLAVLGTTVPFAGCLGAATSGGPPTESATKTGSATTKGSPVTTGSATATGSATPTGSPVPTGKSYVEIRAPTVSRGETVSITIDARSVVHLRFSRVPDTDATVLYGNAEFSPSPTAVWTVRPPTWQWSPPRPVTGAVPIRVPDTVAPDDYRYAIAARRPDSDEELVEGFTLTVRA